MALTTDFVTAVRRQGSIPSTLASTDILALGDDEIQGTFIPLLTDLRSNYFVRQLNASPDVRGRIALPTRAVGAGLRSVQLAMGNGWSPLPQRDLGDANYLSGGGLPDAYALDGGSIFLLPTGSSGTLLLRYAARPGKMCLDTDATLAAAITVVGTPGATTTALTAGFTGSLANCDVVSSGPAHQAKAIGSVLGGAQPNLTALNVDLLEQPIAGDYITASDRSPFVPLPEELFSSLVHQVTANILLSLAYLEEARAQEDKAEKSTARAIRFLKPRNEGNPQTVKGGLRRALGGSRGNWRR